MGRDSSPEPLHDSTLEAQVLADPRFQTAMEALSSLVEELNGNGHNLLVLLRALERLHREIQDGPFQSALPAERSQLYQLMQEIERSGGWPYIPRPQLREFLRWLRPSPEATTERRSGSVNEPNRPLGPFA